ncbi:hypothetical protein D3C74_317230 [compost metagenome]
MNGISSTFDLMPKISCESHKVLQLFWIWVLMNPVQERYFEPMKMFGYRFIGRQHELFNDLFSYRTISLHNIDSFSFIIYNHFGFIKIKINRTSAHSIST